MQEQYICFPDRSVIVLVVCRSIVARDEARQFTLLLLEPPLGLPTFDETHAGLS